MLTTISVNPGDDLYRIAAEQYGDATACTLIMRANNLTDPLVQVSATITIPDYNPVQANGGILASQ